MNALGRHLLVELHGCEPGILDNVDTIRRMMLEAASLMSVTVLHVATRKFEPQGVTAIVMIAESHLSIHTWPEHAYAAVDVFTCNGEIPASVQGCIAGTLRANRVSAIEIKRGILDADPVSPEVGLLEQAR
ncbi:MAG: adenosylmethionine decarboxylase [Chloroflexota bacterium]